MCRRRGTAIPPTDLNLAVPPTAGSAVNLIVEVMGRYSNHADQGELVSAIRDSVPATPRRPEISTTKQVHRRLRPDLVDDLVAGYEGGRTVRQLADQFGIGRETVSKLLSRRSVRTRLQSLTATQTEIAADLYRSGMSLVQIADRMARSRTAIYNALRRNGVQLRPRRGWQY